MYKIKFQVNYKNIDNQSIKFQEKTKLQIYNYKIEKLISNQKIHIPFTIPKQLSLSHSSYFNLYLSDLRHKQKFNPMKNYLAFISQSKQQNFHLKKNTQSLQQIMHRTLKPQIGTKNYIKRSFKTQQNRDQDFQRDKVKLNFTHNEKVGPKFYSSTYRSELMKTISDSSEVLLVHLLYKQKNISIFLNKGVTFEQLIKKMYKQIYISEKESYSNSNVILKNLMFKITGFQSTDNDLLLDYKLKYKKGTLNKQKFFTPFVQDDIKMPFKLYTIISELPNEGHQFLARNSSDGNWSIVRTIKKSLFDDEKVVQMKKSLKNHFNAYSLLANYSPVLFSQINWFETKHYLISVAQFFPQNLQENLKADTKMHKEKQIQQIFVFFSKWLAKVFKQLVNLNISNFQKMSLKTIVLNPDGYPMISVIDNVMNSSDIVSKQKVLHHNSKRNSQRIQDYFYFETYFNLLSEMRSLFSQQFQALKVFEEFFNFLNQQSIDKKFSFGSVLQYFSQEKISIKKEINQKQIQKSPLLVDFTSKFQQIAQIYQNSKNNFVFASQQARLFSQIKQQIHQAYNIQNWRKNHPRNQTYTDIKVTNSGFFDLKKQNIGNLLQFKKQQERKSQIITEERSYIQQIINEMNKNENFIKTTKENNIASIGFYLQKSNQKLKKKMTQKIQNKYKMFLNKKQNPTNQEILKDMRNSSFKKDTFNLKKGSFSQSKSNQNFSFNLQNRKFVSLNKSINQKNLLAMTSQTNRKSEKQTKQNILGFDSSILKKQGLADQSCYGLQGRNSLCRTTMNLSKSKLFDTFSPLITTKRQKLDDLFVNKKDFTKNDKIMLKKKHYGIYLEEAEKQYNKIKALKKCPTLYPLK